ncbi:MAG: 4-hydroxythreonine-4-phosphate dehydrogenase PdxA, partial [Kangiellaceae bacterium]
MPNHFNSNLSLSRVVITMGDPAGVGPELVIKLAQLNFNAQLILLGDANYLVKLASELGFPLELEEIDWEKSVILHKPSKLFIEHIPLQEKVTRGMLSNKNAKTVLRILNRASELALLGKVKAIVTAPVHKANINQIESSFLGHTEFFAEQAKINKVVMMLATKNLRMALATTHIPLSKVSNEITPSLLNEIVRVIDASFNSIGLSKPKIAICGINPHAGEDGLLGTEDRDVLKPVINNLINKGF